MKLLNPLALTSIVGALGLLLTFVVGPDDSVQSLGPRDFRDGDTVCFVGDSLTHSGRYHSYIEAYYLTRFPDRKIQFVNCGVSGDTVDGAIRRLDWDILPNQPTVLSVFFGMNDVKRSNYGPGKNDAHILQDRAAAITAFRRNLLKFAERVSRKDRPKLIFVTSSPYDETTRSDVPPATGVGEGMQREADTMIELARVGYGSLVDFYAPMKAITLSRQRTNPEFSLVGSDRVHLQPEGHLLAAYLYLKAQNVPSLVSSLEIDPHLGSVRSVNGEVTHLEIADERVAFDRLETALPFPVPEVSQAALEWVPIERDLNQQGLKVLINSASRYQLDVDGQVVGTFTAAQLRAGINLANNPLMPQFLQAQAVLALVEQRRMLGVQLRNVAQVRTLLENARVDGQDPKAREAFFAKYAQEAGERSAYFTNLFSDYAATVANLPTLRANMEKLTNEVRQLSRPRMHHYEIIPELALESSARRA